jgi:hypothetical protein
MKCTQSLQNFFGMMYAKMAQKRELYFILFSTSFLGLNEKAQFRQKKTAQIF